MVLSRCVVPPPEARAVVIRTEYLQLSESFGKKITDARCAAALLSALEHWTNFKIQLWQTEMDRRDAAREQNKRYKPQATLWVYMSQKDWHEELMRLFSVKKIATTLFQLEACGLIKSRSNPYYKFDRRYQYLLRAKQVQELLDALCDVQRNRFRQIAESKTLHDRIEAVKARQRKRQTAAAISQESSTPIKSEESDQQSSSSVPATDDDLTFIKSLNIDLIAFDLNAPKLVDQVQRIGRERFQAVVSKCLEKRPKRWEYVVSALLNESTVVITPIPLPPSPESGEQRRSLTGKYAGFFER